MTHSLVAHAAADDNDRIGVLEKKLDQSLQMIRELSARVHELESEAAQHGAAAPQQAAPPSTPAVAAAQNVSPETVQRLAELEQTVNQMAASAGQHAEDRGMPMHGFADVGIGNHNAEFPEYRGADIAELDFFLTPRLGTRTRALFELNFEVGEDGAVGVDLERAQIGYQFGDSATVWLGRFHTPYGFYNTAFHHGQQIATSLRRPRFLEFEDHGGIMPAHTVGLWLTGVERLGEQKLTYDFFVGNSQRISGGTLDMNNPGNTHGSTIFGVNLGWLLAGPLDGLKVGVDAFQTRIEDQDLLPGGPLDGLKVGVDAFQTRIDDEDPIPAAFAQLSPYFTRVRSYGAYAVYDTDRWEDIAELHFFDNADLTGNTGTHRSDAGFIQIGYRAGRYTPYGR
ncbi:MAG TPA: hypothetical protein VEY89_11620, partial [Candidatus Dormibacteraeota bacterium]|nr:hypothetical protein [Candidatus Dormibacteraeota bacterium]